MPRYEVQVRQWWDKDSLDPTYQDKYAITDETIALMEDGWEPVTMVWSNDWMAKFYVILRRESEGAQ